MLPSGSAAHPWTGCGSVVTAASTSPRRSSTWPTSRSRARMRWLTAEALTPSSYAAASNEPSSTIARSACS